MGGPQNNREKETTQSEFKLHFDFAFSNACFMTEPAQAIVLKVGSFSDGRTDGRTEYRGILKTESSSCINAEF